MDETETVAVTYYLHVTISGASGEQEWGPFTKDAANSVAVSVAHRDNVTKVRVERRVG